MGAHSGYHLLTKYLNRPLITIEGTRKPGRGPLGWIQTGLRMVSKAPWYSTGSFRLELLGFEKMLRHRGSIFHFLQADSDLWLGSAFSRLAKTRLFGTIHQPAVEIERIGGPLPGWSRLQVVFTLSILQAEYLRTALPNAQIEFVPIGADTEYFNPRKDSFDLNRPHVISVGRHLRDYEVLVKVLEQLSRRIADVRMTVVGPPSELVPRLTSIGVECRFGLSDDQLRDLYQSAELMVLPLKDATANNALVEAMASGLPTVVTAVGGTLDYCTPGSAVLVQPNDPDEMTDAALNMLENSALHKSVSDCSRQRAEEISWPNVARRVNEVYDSCL